tara:strand:+ start:220 stop:489 length:270 start_codon:yes stop_codon:yes gene_type:complete
MNNYEKINVADDSSNQIKENYTPLSQNLKLKDRGPEYYKLGVRKDCEFPVYIHKLGFTGYKGEVCGQGYVDGEEENKKTPDCKSFPWYC